MAYKNKADKAAHERSRYRRRVIECLEILGGRCVECGSTATLEIDHVDPATKSFTITSGLNLPWNEVLLELRKCQCLCHEHHKVKTMRELTGPRLHGTWAAYTRAKCRCQACRDFFNAYRRNLRQRNAA